MRKQKGFAIPTALALSSVLLVVSVAVTSIILETSIFNRSVTLDDNHLLEFASAHEVFVREESIEHIESTRYRYKMIDLEGTHISALVALKKSVDEIVFYSIYDFQTGKTLAYQTDSFYMPIRGDEEEAAYYLGGIVPLPRDIG